MRKLKTDKLKLIVHLAALTPLAILIYDYFTSNLTANPIRDITFRTGRDALFFLVVTLAITPLSRIEWLKPLRRTRRTIALYSFTYACMHFLTFVGLDYGFDLDLITEAVLKKPFALAGLATFLILIPLALTSTNGWQKRLGKNWRRLHRLIYIAASLDILHFFWQAKSKAKIREPLVYGTIIAILLILRIPFFRKKLNAKQGS